MPKRTGVIKRRNRWYFRVQRNGQRIERGSWTTAEEAYNAKLVYEREVLTSQAPLTSLTVEQLIIKYLTEHEQVYNRHSTVIKNEGVCRNHIIPVIGTRRISELTPNIMRELQTHLMAHKTPSVSHYTMRTLKKIFNWAVEWELMESNPIKGKLPSKPVSEHPTLSPEQLVPILQKAPPREKVIIALGVFAGLRIGEIFGLQWSDVDFNNQTLFIQRQFSTGTIGPVKTSQSMGVIPIWIPLVKMLKEWKLQCASPVWLFPGQHDKPMRPERWRQLQWTKIKREHGLPVDLRFHDLRHTFATLLLSQGADKGDVQQLMRHKSITITMDIYRHLLPKQLTRALEFFNSLSGEQSGERDLLSL